MPGLRLLSPKLTSSVVDVLALSSCLIPRTNTEGMSNTMRETVSVNESINSLFKEAFRNHPAGVAIVTAYSESGPVGLTASSVASVSADPAILAFSLTTESSSALALCAAETVVVHLLSADNVQLASIFATRGTDRFTDSINWSRLDSGEPLLLDAPYALQCRVLQREPAGASIVLIASVLSIRSNADQGDPLVYHNRDFHRLTRHSIVGFPG
jgi:flavin reductase (DIM6/NTAB) family NADH-FMN oxidoreductase RutF